MSYLREIKFGVLRCKMGGKEIACFEGVEANKTVVVHISRTVI